MANGTTTDTLPPIPTNVPGPNNGNSQPKANKNHAPVSSSAWGGPGSPGAVPGAPGYGASSLLGFQQMAISPFLNYAEDALMPKSSPSLWGLDVQGPDHLYVKSYDANVPVPNGARINRLMGDIADKLGIKPQKGKSLREQIVDHLAAEHKLPKGKTDLQDVADAMGVNAEMRMGKNPDANALFGIASHLGVAYPEKTASAAKDATISRAQAAGQLSKLTGPQLEQFKAQLFAGGFYDADTYDNPTIQKRINGIGLDPYTMKAYGNMLNQAAGAYNGGKGKKITWQDFMAQQASGSNLPGYSDAETIQQLLANPKQNSLGTKVAAPSQPLITGDQLLSSLQNAFEQNLGRMPTAKELNQFVGQMNTMEAAHSSNGATQNGGQPMFDYETGLTLAPGMPKASFAAQEFARSDQSDYLAHQMSNAGGMMLDVIKGAGLGGNPVQTSAG